MNEQTPTTQEEKKPLSPAAMLEALQVRANTLRIEIATARTRIKRYELYMAEGAGMHVIRHIQAMQDAIRERQPELAALEQTIAILSVLNRPDFGLVQRAHYLTGSESLRTCQCHCVVKTGDIPPAAGFGETIIGAILAAHTALKPQEGAPGSKGGPTDARLQTHP